MASWLELITRYFGDLSPDPDVAVVTPTNENISSEGVEGESTDMRLGSHNIKNFPDIPRPDVRRAAQIASTMADIIGLQEIEELEDKQDVKSSMPGFQFVTLSRRVCQAYRPKLWKLSKRGPRGFVQTSEGIAYMWPTLGFSIATYESVRRPNLAPFIVINVHFPPGAFKPGVNEPALRIKHWKLNLAMLTDFMNKWQKRGYTVFVTGDFNNPNMPDIKVPNFRWLMHEHIDYIGVAVGSVGIEVTGRAKKITPSDHPAIAITGTLRVKRKVTKK